MASAQRTIMCLDSETACEPGLVGLEDECLSGQPWLVVESDAQRARARFREDDSVGSAWVVSSDTMEGINLAAALKRDRPACSVSLVSFEGSGSVLSRCQAADVDLIRGHTAFVARYASRKEAYKRAALAEEAPAEGCETRSDEAVGRSDSAKGGQAKGTTHRHGEERDAKVVIGRVPGKRRESGDDGFSLIGALPIEEPPSDKPGTAVALPPVPQRLERADDRMGARVSRRRMDGGARLAQGSSGAAGEGFVVSIVSGSGGVGKSTLAVCLALTMKASGKRTLLLDADLQFGDMELLLGGEALCDVAELIADPERIAQADGSGSLPVLISAPQRLEQSELVMGHMAELIGFLRRRFDVIVVNTGAFWSDQQIQILESSDRVAFVLDQRPSSIRACSHALDLCRRCGIATQSFVYVLNYCSRHALLTSLDVSCALQGAQVWEVRDGGREVGELLGSGLPGELLASKNPFGESVRSLCRALTDEAEGAAASAGPATSALSDAAGRGFFSALKRRRAACR